jgi:hypothetical protein
MTAASTETSYASRGSNAASSRSYRSTPSYPPPVESMGKLEEAFDDANKVQI